MPCLIYIYIITIHVHIILGNLLLISVSKSIINKYTVNWYTPIPLTYPGSVATVNWYTPIPLTYPGSVATVYWYTPIPNTHVHMHQCLFLPFLYAF